MVTRTRHQPECRLTSESPSRSGDFSSPARTNRGSEGTRERGSEGAHARARTYARTRAHTHLQTHTNACERKHMGGGEGAESCIARIAARRHRAMRRPSRCLCVSRPSHPFVPGRTVRVIESPHRPDSQFVPLRLHSRSRPGHYLLRVTISSVSLLRPCEYLIRVANSPEPLIRPSHHPFLLSFSPYGPALTLSPLPPPPYICMSACACACACFGERGNRNS